MSKELVERTMDEKFEELMIAIGDREEILDIQKEFFANFNFLKEIIPERYVINLLQLESTMMHMRISSEEHAYRAGLYDGIRIQQQVASTKSCVEV